MHPRTRRRTYGIASTLVALALITATVTAAIGVKRFKKRIPITYGSCYVAWDGDMICVSNISKVAR